MPFRELEHEGNEDFKHQDRKTVAIIDTMKKAAVETLKDIQREEAQKKWLSPENPALWSNFDD
jgi:hypothetical protein